MNKAIEHRLRTGESDCLYKLLPELKRIYKRYAKNHGGDWRSGTKTYGYDNPDSTLEYIKDRWRCAFRIRWIIDGLEKRVI